MEYEREQWLGILETCIVKPAGHIQVEGDAKRLYTITTIARSDRYGGMRTPCICSSFDIARDIVENNSCDIYETSYMLAVIEAIIPDVLYGSLPAEQYWYLWIGDYETGKYIAVEPPDEFKNTTGFGIG
jgi:hypothetical protein